MEKKEELKIKKQPEIEKELSDEEAEDAVGGTTPRPSLIWDGSRKSNG